MKVLHVISSLTRGGAEVQVASLVRTLRQQGVEAEILCIRELGALASELVKENIPVHFHKFRSRLSPLSLWWFRTFLKQGNFHLVHSHMYRSNTSSTVGRLLAGRKPIVCSVHSRKLWDTKRQKAMDRRLHRFRSRMLFVSGEAREIFLKETGCSAEKCLCFPNGVDLSPFDNAEGSSVREELKLAENELLVTMVARFEHAKDYETFLQAVPLVLEQNSGVSFACVGDGRTREAMESLAQSFGEKDSKKIHFLGTRGDIPSILAATDIAVLSSHWEGFPISVLEALAAGKPMIVNPVGAIPDILKDGITGLLFPAKDPKKLAESILRLAKDQASRSSLGTQGRKMVEECFSIEKVTQSLITIYEAVLSEKSLLGS